MLPILLNVSLKINVVLYIFTGYLFMSEINIKILDVIETDS